MADQSPWIDAVRRIVERGAFEIARSDGTITPPTEADWRGIERHSEAEEVLHLDTSEPEPPDGVIVDMFTASMLVQIHDALSPANQAKFADLPLTRAVDVGWQLVNRTRSA